MADVIQEPAAIVADPNRIDVKLFNRWTFDYVQQTTNTYGNEQNLKKKITGFASLNYAARMNHHRFFKTKWSLFVMFMVLIVWVLFRIAMMSKPVENSRAEVSGVKQGVSRVVSPKRSGKSGPKPLKPSKRRQAKIDKSHPSPHHHHPHHPSSTITTPPNFDYFTIVGTWVPGFQIKNPGDFNHDLRNKDEVVLHGVWPSCRQGLDPRGTETNMSYMSTVDWDEIMKGMLVSKDGICKRNLLRQIPHM